MASVAEGLFKSLPKPKNSGEEEEPPKSRTQRFRIVDASQVDDSQVVLRVRLRMHLNFSWRRHLF